MSVALIADTAVFVSQSLVWVFIPLHAMILFLDLGMGWRPFILDHPFQEEESVYFLNAIGEIPNSRCWVGGSTNSNRQYITYPEEYLNKARHAHKRLYTVLPKYSKIQVLPGITSCRLVKDNKQAIELNSLLLNNMPKDGYG